MKLKGTLALDRARDLRQRQTEAEARLWRELRGRRFSGFKFRRQQPMGRFILDFCCFEAKLSIELDGGKHADEESVRADGKRTIALEQMGIKELRFWNTAIFENLEGVLSVIQREIEARTPSPTASR